MKWLIPVLVALIAMVITGVLVELSRSLRSVNTVFAAHDEIHEKIRSDVVCSMDYEKEQFPDCVPTRCGRVVMDTIVTREEAQQILRVAKKGLAKGGSNGGASILDLHSGALSHGDHFINIYSLLEKEDETLFTDEDFALYSELKGRIHRSIADEFGIPADKLYLTKPTFFSMMTNKPAQTIHDEYWHQHIDKETYGSFHYTSLLYLTTYTEDFTGGRFVFTDTHSNTTVEPRQGRVSFFTSGSENVHYVERVESGTRYAITVSFTCDPAKAIDDPVLPKAS